MLIYALFYCIITPNQPQMDQCWNEGMFPSLHACEVAKSHRGGAVLTDAAKRNGTTQRFSCMKKEVPTWQPAE
jgi:hypothetical protein